MTDANEMRSQIRRLFVQFERSGVNNSRIDIDGLSSSAMSAVYEARSKLASIPKKDMRWRYLDRLPFAELESFYLELIRNCVEGRLHSELAQADISHPIYNFFAGFSDNAKGPWDRYPAEPSVSFPKSWKLLGQRIGTPIGVPASGLTANSNWIQYFSRHGFNVLTYKTVRSREVHPHAYPHWVFVEDLDPLGLDELQSTRVIGGLDVWPKSLRSFSTANSFGVPSPAPEVWQEDVKRSLDLIRDGQLLILSVMGTSGATRESLVSDFATVASQGVETGVPAIELNLSCPNTVSPKSAGMDRPICEDVDASLRIVRSVRDAVGDSVKLVVKIGYLSESELEKFVPKIGPYVDGVSAINTIPVNIVSSTSGVTPFVGVHGEPDRLRSAAGLSGAAIRQASQQVLAGVVRLKHEYDLRFDVIGMGGIMDAPTARDVINSGVDAVQMATAACTNQELPIELHELLESADHSKSTKDRRGWLDKVGDVLSSGGLSLVR